MGRGSVIGKEGRPLLVHERSPSIIPPVLVSVSNNMSEDNDGEDEDEPASRVAKELSNNPIKSCGAEDMYPANELRMDRFACKSASKLCN
eukprot:m.43347 g.43347  ORF g.43347 m.43347 type:complete len:90 (-) comp10552_c0_seq1:1089-1358(-)